MAEYNLRYKVGSSYYTPEEYEKEFGKQPNRMDTFSYGEVLRKAIFDPYFDHAMGVECTSYKDQEKKVREWNKRNPHRKFDFANDDKKFMDDLKYRSKHKEEYKEMLYKEVKYKGGQRIVNPEQRGPKGTVYSFPKTGG